MDFSMDVEVLWYSILLRGFGRAGGMNEIRKVRREDQPDDFAMNGAGDAVLQLEVHLGHGVFGED